MLVFIHKPVGDKVFFLYSWLSCTVFWLPDLPFSVQSCLIRSPAVVLLDTFMPDLLIEGWSCVGILHDAAQILIS